MSQAMSGKSGTAYMTSPTEGEIVEVTGWNFEPVTNVPKYASNATGGHKVGVPAVDDFTGSITTKLDADGHMPFRHGDIVMLYLHVDDTGLNYIEAPVVIAGHPIPCDINDGEIIEVEYSFEPRGRPTYHGILSIESGSSSG